MAWTDLSPSLAVDHSPGAPAVLVTFSGLAQQVGMPAFEFFKVTAGLGCHRVFVRDLDACWYQRGFDGHGIEGSAARLDRLVAELGVDRVVMAGNSAGGFGALVFGALLEADVVLAWAPTAFLSPELRAVYGEDRWPTETVEANAVAACLDVSSVMPQVREAHVWWGIQHHQDALHVAHLTAGFRSENVCAHPIEYEHHDVVTHLRNRGKLRRLMREAVSLTSVAGWCQ